MDIDGLLLFLYLCVEGEKCCVTQKKEAKKFNSERNVIKKEERIFFVSYSAKMPINMYEIEKWKN